MTRLLKLSSLIQRKRWEMVFCHSRLKAAPRVQGARPRNPLAFQQLRKPSWRKQRVNAVLVEASTSQRALRHVVPPAACLNHMAWTAIARTPRVVPEGHKATSLRRVRLEGAGGKENIAFTAAKPPKTTEKLMHHC